MYKSLTESLCLSFMEDPQVTGVPSSTAAAPPLSSSRPEREAAKREDTPRTMV
jgi:hypothetical protein